MSAIGLVLLAVLTVTPHCFTALNAVNGSAGSWCPCTAVLVLQLPGHARGVFAAMYQEYALRT